MGKGRGSNKFNEVGPTHLKHTDVDWTREAHRRIVAACLVKGVYVLERDRQKTPKGAQPLAEPWFMSFKFKLDQRLFDPRDNSIYGAIYRFESLSDPSPPEAPKYVIAFRSTMLKKKSCTEDLKLDCAILHQYFHRTKRSKSAIVELESVVKADNSNVWLAGHSLGSALAVQVGKNAAKKDIFLKTFLFNPPFPRVKQWLSSVGKVTAKLVTWFKGPHQLSDHEPDFAEFCRTTAKWSPYLFVNKHDSICSGYIKYFKQRQKMTKKQARATMYSVRALFMNWIKAKLCCKENKNGDYEPFYLLPSASLITNTDKTGCHEIAQWWSLNLQLEPTATPYQCTFCPLLNELEKMTM